MNASSIGVLASYFFEKYAKYDADTLERVVKKPIQGFSFQPKHSANQQIKTSA